MSSIQLSVIMPVYNAALTIRAALESALDLANLDLEIIVVDDGSTDDSLERITGFERVRIVRQRNAGPAAARNRGLGMAQGSIIGFLDADDLWQADAVGAALNVFQTLSDTQILQGRIRDLYNSVQGIELGEPRFAFNVGAALFRRGVIEQIGGFDETLRNGEDIDLWVRLAEQGIHPYRLQDTLLHYRRRTATAPNAAAQRDYHSRLLHTVKRSISRTHSGQ